MRSKTTILGLLVSVLMGTLFVAARPTASEADYGFNPGEQLPSIEVEGVRWLSDLQYDSMSYVVVWSKDDAVSRAVASWVSRSANNSGVGAYSICLDADQTDTRLIASLDNTSHGAELLGMKSGSTDKQDLKVLKDNAEGRLFIVKKGVIQRALKTDEAWSLISSGTDLLKEPAVFGASAR